MAKPIPSQAYPISGQEGVETVRATPWRADACGEETVQTTNGPSTKKEPAVKTEVV
ncbi:hypothetical protein [Bombella favorum]|uniref:hypothetical protein n=1 Tax=Bombella favorum TaxID=2039164 RepID=UPI0015F52485|nr:hypothetical protein [Bombella favorum]